jgi:hypothetical protein
MAGRTTVTQAPCNKEKENEKDGSVYADVRSDGGCPVNVPGRTLEGGILGCRKKGPSSNASSNTGYF